MVFLISLTGMDTNALIVSFSLLLSIITNGFITANSVVIYEYEDDLGPSKPYSKQRRSITETIIYCKVPHIDIICHVKQNHTSDGFLRMFDEQCALVGLCLRPSVPSVPLAPRIFSSTFVHFHPEWSAFVCFSSPENAVERSNLQLKVGPLNTCLLLKGELQKRGSFSRFSMPQ